MSDARCLDVDACLSAPNILVCLSCTAEYQNREQEYSGIILVFGSAAQADFQIFGRIFGGTLLFQTLLPSFAFLEILNGSSECHNNLSHKLMGFIYSF